MGALGVVGLLLVVLSPYALLVLSGLSDQDWERLSLIGQTYGAVSALLAAGALCGVAVSIRQQQRLEQVGREHVFRTVHLELTRMLFDHPDLMDSYASSVGTDDTYERRLNLYCNQRVLSLLMGYEVGAINDQYVAGAAKELLGSPNAQRWWAQVRDSKRGTLMSSRQERVVDIVDREWLLVASASAEVDGGDLAGYTALDALLPHTRTGSGPEPEQGVRRSTLATGGRCLIYLLSFVGAGTLAKVSFGLIHSHRSVDRARRVAVVRSAEIGRRPMLEEVVDALAHRRVHPQAADVGRTHPEDLG
jgi:hypothetical protein